MGWQMDKDKTVLAMNLVTMMIVEDIAEETGRSTEEVLLDFIERDHNLLATQQVFDLDGARVDQRLPFFNLIDVGHDKRLDVVARAIRNEAVDFLPCFA